MNLIESYMKISLSYREISIYLTTKVTEVIMETCGIVCQSICLCKNLGSLIEVICLQNSIKTSITRKTGFLNILWEFFKPLFLLFTPH